MVGRPARIARAFLAVVGKLGDRRRSFPVSYAPEIRASSGGSAHPYLYRE
jgi:hypothetical protein